MDERMKILDKIDKGEISPSEGARLLDQIRTGETIESTAESVSDRMKILEGIEQGKISPAEGANQLKKTNTSKSRHIEVRHENTSGQGMTIEDNEIAKWRSWWMIPFWIGSAIILLAGLWMNASYQAAGTNFWFYCSWVPMLIGLGLAIIGVMSQRSRWLHIRIKQRKDTPARVALSFPFPIGVTAWLLKTFGGMIPGLEETALDEVILALGNETGENPLFIQVDDDEDGEQVEIFIG